MKVRTAKVIKIKEVQIKLFLTSIAKNKMKTRTELRINIAKA